MIVGDNGDIFRIVSGGSVSTGYCLQLRHDYGRPQLAGQCGASSSAPCDSASTTRRGGPDYAAAAATDLGGADELHGESGDDRRLRQMGDDMLFGDGQDD